MGDNCLALTGASSSEQIYFLRLGFVFYLLLKSLSLPQ
jgi:hypothetical protein